MSMESRIAHRWARSEKTARYLTLTFHTDPGHGWLEVPIAMLKELGIHKDISPYSYRRGQNAYLEEDVDAGKFMRAAKEAGWNIRYREQHKNDSPIRDYRGYRSASEKTAKAKNKRVFIDWRGETVILDFRGDSGMRALDPKKLQNLYRDFAIDVVNTEKKVGLISSSKGHSAIEVYQGELGFHIQRWYKARDIRQLPLFQDSTQGVDPQTGEVGGSELWRTLRSAGWRVTFK